MITRFNPPYRSETPPQWRGACAAVAGGGPNRATAIVVARLVFTISGQSRAFTALRLVDVVTASHSHMNELATLEYGLQQLALLENRRRAYRAPASARLRAGHNVLDRETEAPILPLARDRGISVSER